MFRQPFWLLQPFTYITVHFTATLQRKTVCASPVGDSASFLGDAGRFALLGFGFRARAATKGGFLLGSFEARLKVPFPTLARRI